MAKNENTYNEYRDERKKRLAKNAKKSNKKTIDSVTITTYVIRAIIAIALVAFLCFAFIQFGVPHKILPAVKVGDRTYTAAEYGFFYSSVFQSYAEQSSQLSETYGYTTFDYTKDPASQTTTDEDGNTITYDELFRQGALANMESTGYYLEKCETEGVVLSEEHTLEIASLLEELTSAAESTGVSLNRYISLAYGKGLSLSKFEKLIHDQFLVAQYIEGIEEDCYNNITDEELEAAYAADPSDFEAVDLRLFGFEVADYEEPAEETTVAEETTIAEDTTVAEETTSEAVEAETENETASSEETTADEETTVAEEEEKEPSKTEILAQEMLGRITDEASFIELAKEYASEEDKEVFADDTATLAKSIKKSAVASSIGEDVAEWIYSSDRVVGDKRVCVTDEFVYVVYIIKTSYRNDEPLVDARHILVTFDQVASELAAAEGNTINVTKDENIEVTTAKTEEEIEITNEGTGYSIELVNETYKRARDIYDLYLKGEITEEAFAALAEEHSQDPGSVGENGSGGLYESIERGTMVEAFDDWVYDPAREPGDVDLVMTNYGWHIMYFVKQHDEPAWKADVRNTLGVKAFDEMSEEVKTSYEGTASQATFYKFASDEAYKNIASRF